GQSHQPNRTWISRPPARSINFRSIRLPGSRYRRSQHRARKSPQNLRPRKIACRQGPREMKKKCRACKQVLDSSSFSESSKEPDRVGRVCSACVNRRRRERYATKKSDLKHGSQPRLRDLVKKGDLAAIKKSESLINAENTESLLALAVTDFKRATKKPSHVE